MKGTYDYRCPVRWLVLSTANLFIIAGFTRLICISTISNHLFTSVVFTVHMHQTSMVMNLRAKLWRCSVGIQRNLWWVSVSVIQNIQTAFWKNIEKGFSIAILFANWPVRTRYITKSSLGQNTTCFSMNCCMFYSFSRGQLRFVGRLDFSQRATIIESLM